MPATELTGYAALAPAGQEEPLSEVEITFPTLKNPAQRNF